jgi:resuscitation-promoting factor RpfA
MGFLDDVKKNLGFAEKGRHQVTVQQPPEGTTVQAPPPDSAATDAAAVDAATVDAAAREAAAEDAEAPEQDAAAAAVQEAVAAQSGAAPARPGQITEVVVEPGDTLSGIAAQFGVDADALLAANADTVPNPDLIYPGQVLRLP